MPFNHTISPPPVPQQQPPANTNPANVFAQMKSGTFATDNTGAPQSADKYDVLRPARMCLVLFVVSSANKFDSFTTRFSAHWMGRLRYGWYAWWIWLLNATALRMYAI